MPLQTQPGQPGLGCHQPAPFTAQAALLRVNARSAETAESTRTVGTQRPQTARFPFWTHRGNLRGGSCRESIRPQSPSTMQGPAAGRHCSPRGSAPSGSSGRGGESRNKPVRHELQTNTKSAEQPWAALRISQQWDLSSWDPQRSPGLDVHLTLNSGHRKQLLTKDLQCCTCGHPSLVHPDCFPRNHLCLAASQQAPGVEAPSTLHGSVPRLRSVVQGRHGSQSKPTDGRRFFC